MTVNKMAKRKSTKKAKKITDKERILMTLEIEKVKLAREKAIIALDKSLFLYFIFLFIAIIGFINGLANLAMLNILVILGIIVLITGSLPYLRYTVKQKNMLDGFINKLKHD